MVADDVLTNQMLTARLLTKIGYKPHCVTNGREALEAIEQGHFDLILMDCQMPEMDGFETTQKIRAHISDRIKDIPIIALTANAMPGDKEKCLQVGMNDYLSKPLKKEMLAETLAKWLLQSVSIRAS